MADFFCTRSAAESSDLEFVPLSEVSNIESRNPTPSIASISCRQLAFAAILAKTVTTWSLAKRVVKGDLLTAFTNASGVPQRFIAAELSGDMNVRLANAAVTSKNVSSPPFKRERPEMVKKNPWKTRLKFSIDRARDKKMSKIEKMDTIEIMDKLKKLKWTKLTNLINGDEEDM